jgi:transposase
MADNTNDSTNSPQTRRHFSAADKVAILKRHLLEGVPISQVCDESGIKPSLFYYWQRLLFENAPASFDNGRRPKVVDDGKDRKIEQLEAKLQRKNEVLSELMEEHTQLKKNLGEL